MGAPLDPLVLCLTLVFHSPYLSRAFCSFLSSSSPFLSLPLSILSSSSFFSLISYKRIQWRQSVSLFFFLYVSLSFSHPSRSIPVYFSSSFSLLSFFSFISSKRIQWRQSVSLFFFFQSLSLCLSVYFSFSFSLLSFPLSLIPSWSASLHTYCIMAPYIPILYWIHPFPEQQGRLLLQ